MDADIYLKQYNDLVHQEQCLRHEANYGLSKLKELRAYRHLLRKNGMAEVDEKLSCIEQNCYGYLKQAADLHDLQLEILEVIESIPDIEGVTLHARYVDCLTWEKISEQTNYSWTGIHHVMERALKKVQEMIEQESS